MNRIFLILVLFISSASFSQSLRDSLFSGKLKADSALVAKSKLPAKDSTAKKPENDSLKMISAAVDSTIKQAEPQKAELKYSDNNRTWKKFTDEYSRIITAEMMT
ncbi:MAG TPA: hypothetical protein VJ765_02275, partial [Chitinophagaceae bacterium]|nr:hypothetical protein [Chitinophagaceae bacterium]